MPVLFQEYMLCFSLPLNGQPRIKLLRTLSTSLHLSAYKKNNGEPDMAWHGIFMTRHGAHKYGMARKNIA